MPDQEDLSFGGLGPAGQQLNPAYAADYANQLRALATNNLNNRPEAKSWAGVLGNIAQTWGGLQQMNRANALQQAGMSQAQQARSSIGQPGAQGGAGLLGASPTAGTQGGDPVSAMAPAIAKVESGGNYSAIGHKTANGDQAYGKYQVMGRNIPGWTQEALGQSLTPQQFLANPQAQEAVFHAKMGGYLQQTGNPQDAASMWISGKPLAQALASGNRPDVNGTTPSAYSSAVVSALRGGGQQIAQASPTTGMNGRQYGALMTNSWIPQEEKRGYQEIQTPQTRVGATGQIIPFTPGQQPGGNNEIAGGYVTAPFGVPGFQGTAGAPTRNNVPQNPQAIVPPVNGQGQGGSGSIEGWAGVGRGLQGQTDTQGNQIQTLRDYTNAGGESHRMLGALGNLEEAGKHVGQSGWQQYVPGQWLAYAQSHGIPVDQDGSITGFKVAAMQALGTGPEWQGLREQIPQLNNTPEARMAIIQQIRSMHQYIAQRGDVSRGIGPNGKPDPNLNGGGPDVYQKRLDAAQATQMQTPGSNTPAGNAQGKPVIPAATAAPGETSGQAVAALSAAKAAIAKGAPREKVIERLQAAGISPAGL